MALPGHKTKIVATIGPASRARETLERMIRAGVNVARLNFSHGDFASHAELIANIRAAEKAVGSRVAIMADLPGPKMRIGELAEESIALKAGDEVTLTTEPLVGSAERMSVSFEPLPRVVKEGNRLFLNDGIVELEVVGVAGQEVRCRTVVGGELRSRKGLNLPGIDLGISAFTERDREILAFALDHGVDAVSQSFVERADDLRAVRAAAAEKGKQPFLIAKIERAGALENLDEILDAADGIMIARGDLGVEIAIERMAIVQKDLMWRARLRGKPVITATHMLESMVESRRPTRAEATDVANAILDGTDAVMLSGESAMGRFPVDSVWMLARIATVTEPHRDDHRAREALKTKSFRGDAGPVDLVAVSVYYTLGRAAVAAVIAPTMSGATARKLARFRLPVWIVGVSPHETTCRGLLFSYGVAPVHEPQHLTDWRAFARRWLAAEGLEGDQVIVAEGPSDVNPLGGHRMELLAL